MLTLGPIYVAICGMILCGAWLVGMVWIPEPDKSGNKHIKLIMNAINGIENGLIFWISLIILDFVIKVGFLGLLSYGNIEYHLATIIISLVTVIIAIGYVALRAPTFKTLIYASIYVGAYIYALWLHYDMFLEPRMAFLYKPLMWATIFMVSAEITIDIIYILFKKNPTQIRPLWDISDFFNKFFNKKVLFMLWLLFSIEVILKMEGMSILFWL